MNTPAANSTATPAPAQWRSQGERRGLALMVGIYRLCGARICLFFTWWVVLYFYLTDGPRRRELRRFHASVAKRDLGFWAGFSNYWSFARCLYERFAVWDGAFPLAKIQWEAGREHIYDCFASRRGALIISAHYGNVEVLRAWSGTSTPGLEMKVLMDTAGAQQYRKMLESFNAQVFSQVIEVGQITPATAMALSQELSQGRFLGLMGDRLPPGSAQRTLRLDFLGRPCLFPAGPFILASILGAPVFMLLNRRDAQGVYRVHLHKLCDAIGGSRHERQARIEELAGHYVRHLEAAVLQDPSQWYNFHDLGAPPEASGLRGS